MAITNNNVKNVKFLRNGVVFTPADNKTAREIAIEQMELQKPSLDDGTAILGRYQETNGTVKTLVGFAYISGDTKTLTIFDVDGTSADIEKLRQEIDAKLGEGVTSANTATAQLAALSGNGQSTSAETSVEGAKRYADELKNEMDYSGITTSDAAVVTNVTEADGIVAATSANVGNLKLTDYTSGSSSDAVAATDTINEAFGKIENQIATANADIDEKIEALDGTITAEAGYYINKVDEVDGKISGTTAALPTVAAISEAGKPITAVSENLGEISASAGTINAEYVNVADAGNLFTASTVETVLAEIDAAYKAADDAIVGDATESGNTLGKLEDRIEALDADAKEYHIVKTTTGLPETIKESYSLVDADGNVSGVTIDIPKDSHIVSITYDGTTQKLTYNYIDVSGNTQSTDVDMSELVLETEFGSGVTVTDHVAHGVVDSTSEKDSSNNAFLTVGANGFKVDGIKAEIEAKINDLDVAVINPGEGKYIYAIEENNGLIAASGANVSEAVLNNYSKGNDGTAVADTDTVNQAISKLENQIDAAEEAAKAAATIIASGSSADTTEHLEIATTTDSTTSAKTYTFNLKDIASQTDLNELSGKTVTALTSTNGSISTQIDDAAGCKTYDIQTDASKIQMSGFTSTDVLSSITTSSSITEAMMEIDKVITENEQVISAALNDLEATKLENIVVNDKTGTVTSNVATVTIDGGDIDLTGYQSGATGDVAASDSVNAAISKLNTKIAAAVAGGVNSVVAGSGITVDNTDTNNPVVSAKLADPETITGLAENAIKFNGGQNGDNGLYIDTLDCGVY